MNSEKSTVYKFSIILNFVDWLKSPEDSDMVEVVVLCVESKI